MKTIIENRVNPETPLTFPCLLKHKKQGYVVLAISHKKGTILYETLSSDYKFGFYSENWVTFNSKHDWIKFDESLRLEN